MFNLLESVALTIFIFFISDRAFKIIAIAHFFHRNTPTLPKQFPSVSLIQPITHQATNLEENLRSRFQLIYPGKIEYIFICDRQDLETRSLCANILQNYPQTNTYSLAVEPDRDNIASKIFKMQAGLKIANSEVFCFIDDDIALKDNALTEAIAYLLQPQVGAVFGIACGVCWNTVWSSLMSLFININAAIAYIPLTYLLEPYTITGHFFCIQKTNFYAARGFEDMQGRFDDDHELARRLKNIGLKSVQTPIIYKISNQFLSWSEYANQLKRWFIFPRQGVIPYLSWREKLLSYLLSFSLFVPSLLLLLTIITLSFKILILCAAILIISTLNYIWQWKLYLKNKVNWFHLLLLPIVIFFTPIQIAIILFLANNKIIWRGQIWEIK